MSAPERRGRTRAELDRGYEEFCRGLQNPLRRRRGILAALFAAPRAEARPVQWHKAIAASDRWVGHIGDRWGGFELFMVERTEFAETGETYCLHSRLNDQVVSCYPTLAQAQETAEQQWRRLVAEGVEVR